MLQMKHLGGVHAQDEIRSLLCQVYDAGHHCFDENYIQELVEKAHRVLHGDAVLDTSLDCTILSGDVIIRHLAAELKPDHVVFLTDVLGVYDRPPTERDAVLLREISVREDGSWFVLKPELQDMNTQVDITVAAHDTTGGMVTKISEAAMIAKHGIDVCIVKAATNHSLRALRGDLKEKIPDDWLGTVIRLAK